MCRSFQSVFYNSEQEALIGLTSIPVNPNFLQRSVSETVVVPNNNLLRKSLGNSTQCARVNERSFLYCHLRQGYANAVRWSGIDSTPLKDSVKDTHGDNFMSYRLIDKMLLMNVFYFSLFGNLFALFAGGAQCLELGIRKLE